MGVMGVFTGGNRPPSRGSMIRLARLTWLAIESLSPVHRVFWSGSYARNNGLAGGAELLNTGKVVWPASGPGSLQMSTLHASRAGFDVSPFRFRSVSVSVPF